MVKRRSVPSPSRKSRAPTQRIKGPEPFIVGGRKDGPVPTEPPVFRELERLGLVVPASKRGRVRRRKTD